MMSMGTVKAKTAEGNEERARKEDGIDVGLDACVGTAGDACTSRVCGGMCNDGMRRDGRDNEGGDGDCEVKKPLTNDLPALKKLVAKDKTDCMLTNDDANPPKGVGNGFASLCSGKDGGDNPPLEVPV